MAEPWVFGETPLDQTVEAAAVLRRVVGLLLAAEQDDPAVDRLVADLRRFEADVAGRSPVGRGPRLGAAADGDGRVYLDHGRDIGAYNPCFPEYELAVDGERATGTVTFPIAYEGPPGLVHGGHLALLVDAVVQHHHCAVGQAGKTRAMALKFRQPAPLLTPLTLVVERRAEGGRLHSTVQLRDGERLVCEAEVEAVAGDRAALPEVSPRRRE